MINPISAVIPVRNGMQFLPGFLKSNVSLFQELDEIIFVNDGSSDNTFKFLSSELANFPNIKVFDNPNPGLVNALNLGILNSKNDWIARFDVDDEYAQNRFVVQCPLIGDRVGAIFSDYEVVASDGTPLGVISSPYSPILTELSLANSRRTPHPIALLNKHAVQKVGGYLEFEHPAEDLGLWLRLSRAGYTIKSAPEILLRYKVHTGSITSQKGNEMERRKSELLTIHDFSKIYEISFTNWRKEMKTISNLNLGSQRKFLSSIDLLALAKLCKLETRRTRVKKNFIVLLTLANPKVIYAGVKYYSEALTRHSVRNS